ncbi:MAG TPA: V-type ATP synthase subunit F [Gemmatimonadaceae bacterium]|nr:V-type ATP synthase subunit F [Gemmatimonadaceae bacterium]
MSYRVRAVASPALAAGLRLAGLPTDDAETPEIAAARVAALVDDPALGILLVEQPLLEGFPPLVRQALEARAVPILVPVPRAEWGAPTGRAEAYILDLLRRAIGYRVRLQ